MAGRRLLVGSPFSRRMRMRVLDTRPMRRSFDVDLNFAVEVVLIGRNYAEKKFRGVIWSQASRKAVSRQGQSVLTTTQH